MLLSDLVAATDDVAATRARKEKTERLAALVRTSTPAEVALVVDILAGQPRQGRIGVGWATVAALAPRVSDVATVTVAELDELLSTIALAHGEGSKTDREVLLNAFLSRTTAREADFVRRLLVGELRQGANEGIVVEAVAKSVAVPAALVRRAVMLIGDLGSAAEIALREGRPGLEAVGLEVLRPVQPMLASTARSVSEAVAELGRVSVEWKLDGVRIQVHRDNDRVNIWTRNLNDITDSLPGVADTVRQLEARRLVLDGEVLGIDDDGRPFAFQDTVRSTSSVTPFFFDLLHRDGNDLLDAPLEQRIAELADVAGDLRIPGIITENGADAEVVLAESLRHGHEGVLVKAADSPYQAGRRGKTWRKVKPVHTLDLVVLAVEHGSGRRSGWLSNIHLGARDREGGFVMVGKTFKGMTDVMLEWQTRRFRELEVETKAHVVVVRPEQVVEVAVDGIQRSTRYPGGVALRFARVVRYRDDKAPEQADTLDTVRALRR